MTLPRLRTVEDQENLVTETGIRGLWRYYGALMGRTELPQEAIHG
jgi:hypothetical protein